jgi:hypothetical protein
VLNYRVRRSDANAGPDVSCQMNVQMLWNAKSVEEREECGLDINTENADGAQQ